MRPENSARIEGRDASRSGPKVVRAAKISKTEAYSWRREDEEFLKAWDDAVEDGLDMLETTVYRRAIDGSDGLLTMYLKCRRPEKWNPDKQPAPNNTLNLKITTFYDAYDEFDDYDKKN